MRTKDLYILNMGWKTAMGMLLVAAAGFAEDANRLKTLDKGAFSGIQQPLQTVISNQTQWAELWTRHTAKKTPQSAPPEVNFSKESVVFVGLGRKNTGGYSVEITEINKMGDKTEVLVATREPKPGGLNIQALTAPFHIVVTDKITGEVKFKVVQTKKGG